MITLDQARPHSNGGAFRTADVVSPALRASAADRVPRIARQLLHATLFLTILISPFVMIEPSPYEFAVMLLAFACLLAGVTVHRTLLPLLWLLTIWNVGGVIAAFGVADKELTGRFVIITVFVSISAVVFAALMSKDSVRRLAILRSAYIVAAVIASAAGIVGYFKLFPGAEALFAPSGRASGTFKDPNVYGPFLILPILFLMQTVLARGIRPLAMATLLFVLLGFFLSFSRGAWGHFLVSAAVMVALMILTAESSRVRVRLIALSAIGLVALAAALAAALSFDAIADMFKERARVVQYYDVGSGGRFTLQSLALSAILEFPWGMGPFEFSHVYGQQQHNVYLQAFLVYGWAGGFAYVTLVLMTLVLGMRAALMRTPWQPFAIAVFATFVGAAGEGLVIDSDHWRHYFLLLGLIWGLFAASLNVARTRSIA